MVGGHRRGLGGEALVEICPTHSGGAARQGAGQHQGHHLGRAVLLPPGRLHAAGGEGGVGHNGLRVHIAAKAAAVTVVFAVVEVEFTHDTNAPFKAGYFRCALELWLS